MIDQAPGNDNRNQ